MRMKKLLMVLSVAILALVLASPAKAESITLTLNGGSGLGTGTFGCTGTNGCFGNDITLDVSGSGTSWTVTYSINTAGNTNPGSGIASVSFVLTGFSMASGVSLTAAPGGIAGWSTGNGPSNAGGCQGSTSNHICSGDISVLANPSGGFSASPLSGATYTWSWSITGQTFGGFDANTHIQALFGNIQTTQDCGKTPAPCFKQTGLISSHTASVPEPGTMLLFGAGLLGLGALRRRLS